MFGYFFTTMATPNDQNIQEFLAAQISDIYEMSEAQAIIALYLEALAIDTHTNIATLDLHTFDAAMTQLKSGKPVQQIIGQAYFWDRFYKVNEHTLIPRPETEELMYWIKQMQYKNIQNIIDIGTGSGCIACTLKLFFPEANVYALDISAEALTIAQTNAANNNLDIHFIKGDILSDINTALPQFDLIVSNPPYITDAEKAVMHTNVLDYEPHSALFVTNDDPLQFYKAIANFSDKHLAENGHVFLELNKDYGKATQLHYNSLGYNTELKQDMQYNDRMLKAWK